MPIAQVVPHIRDDVGSCGEFTVETLCAPGLPILDVDGEIGLLVCIELPTVCQCGPARLVLFVYVCQVQKACTIAMGVESVSMSYGAIFEILICIEARVKL